MSKSPENPATNTSENPIRNTSFLDREREIEEKLETGEIKKPDLRNNYTKGEIEILMQGIREIHREMEANGGNLPEIDTRSLYDDSY